MANGATPFDKLDYIELLKAAGIDEHQAKAHADAHARSMHAHMAGNVATRADLAELKDALTWRMLGFALALGGLVVALAKGWL